MDILVAYGSKYGSTRSIAERIAQVLNAAGHYATAEAASKSSALDAYQGVVLGSGVYAGRLHGDLLALLTAQRAALASRRVAVFTVSMTAAEQDPAKRATAQAYLKPFAAALQPTQTACFSGMIEPANMPWLMRFVVKAMGAKPTDARDWSAIESWAQALAAAWK